MAAFDHTVLHFRDISQHFYRKLLFQKFFHPGIQHWRHLVKDHALDMAVVFIFQKAFHIGSQRHTHPTAVYDQDHRRIRNRSQIIGTGSGCGASHTVIISHNAFHYRNLTVSGILCQKISRTISICKKSIQVPGFCSDHTAVEHRINIVRSAFKRCSF